MASSVGKRLRERQKLERAQAKAERKATRLATRAEPTALPHRSESELIEELEELHLAFEAGGVSPEDYDEGRARLQSQFEQL